MALAPPRSDFVECVLPPYSRLANYDRRKPPSEQANASIEPLKRVPQAFIDAMVVREEVFVKEQGVLLENELDSDDRRSFHWVAYASMPSKPGALEGKKDSSEIVSTRVPIGTIRVVPAPNPPHEENDRGVGDQGQESYVKIGRLAVVKDFRKMGISNLLIRRAIDFVAKHPGDVRLQLDPAEREVYLQKNAALEFQGLIMVHAQIGVQKIWAKYGFETDEALGTWDEEGIDHVGMWKRVDTSKARD
jgi:predicted GNAT family N-acyltransferase